MMENERKKRIYTNLTNFMKTKGISYGNRIVLQVINKIFQKGYELKAFFKYDLEYHYINNQMFMEYFFTKRIRTKEKYREEELFEISDITDDDIYFEIDELKLEGDEWLDYYSALRRQNCGMFLYQYFNFSLKREKQLRQQLYLSFQRIYFENNNLFEDYVEEIESSYVSCNILPISDFSNYFSKDEILEMDKGMVKIMQCPFVIYLSESTYLYSNLSDFNIIQKKYPEHKLLVYLSEKANRAEMEKKIFNNKKFGEKIFLITDIDYFTILNLYAHAEKVLISKRCQEECKLEIVNIKKINGTIEII